MKKSSFQISLECFLDNMIEDNDFLVKIKGARNIVKSLDEKREVFEAYVFKICANWEILAESLIIDCLNKDTTRYREFTGFGIPKHCSRETCKALILGTGYLDCKSVADLKQKAKNMLVPQYNPFKKIPPKMSDTIDDFFRLRNYLAHYSESAKRSLEKMYQKRYRLKYFKTPGVLLLAEDRKQRVPRMAVYIFNFMDTANIMAKFLGVDLD